MKNLLLLSVAAVLVSPAFAVLDYISSTDGSSWSTITASSEDFTSLIWDNAQDYHIAIGIDTDGDVHRFYGTPSGSVPTWVGPHPAGGGIIVESTRADMSSLATMDGYANHFMGIRSDGQGINHVTNADWNNANTLTKIAASDGIAYNDIALRSHASGLALAAKSNGGVDRYYWNGSAWNYLSDVQTGTTYTDLDTVYVPGSPYYGYYLGMTAGGQIDAIRSDATANWSTVADIRASGFSGSYTSMAGDPNGGDYYVFLATRDSGGIDRFRSTSGDGFAADLVGDINTGYTDVIADPDTTNTYYALHDGGVDCIYFNSGWQVQEISTNAYDMLSMDYSHEAGTFGVYAASRNAVSEIDGVPVSWILEHFGTVDGFSGSGDPDEDLFDNLSEYLADTDPNAGTSLLAMLGVSVTPSNAAVTYQNGGSNSDVIVEHRTDLEGQWVAVDTNSAPENATNTFVDGYTGITSFYRVRAGRND